MGKVFASRVRVRMGLPKSLRRRSPLRLRMRMEQNRPHRVRFGWPRGMLAVVVAISGLMAAGCEGDAGRGALIGGGLGLAGGTIIGHQSGHAGEGALIGGLLGATTGSAIGAQRDLRRERERGRYAYEEGYGRGYDEGYYESRRPQRRRHYHDDYCDH